MNAGNLSENCFTKKHLKIFFSLHAALCLLSCRGKGSFGGGGGNEEQQRMMYIAMVTGLGFLSLLALYEMGHKEITWKEFVVNYLAKGIVSSVFIHDCFPF